MKEGPRPAQGGPGLAPLCQLGPAGGGWCGCLRLGAAQKSPWGQRCPRTLHPSWASRLGPVPSGQLLVHSLTRQWGRTFARLLTPRGPRGSSPHLTFLARGLRTLGSVPATPCKSSACFWSPPPVFSLPYTCPYKYFKQRWAPPGRPRLTGRVWGALASWGCWRLKSGTGCSWSWRLRPRAQAPAGWLPEAALLGV